jgi:hypothetical protein
VFVCQREREKERKREREKVFDGAHGRYAGKDLNKEQYQGEIMELENKRNQLLQVGELKAGV